MFCCGVCLNFENVLFDLSSFQNACPVLSDPAANCLISNREGLGMSL